MKMLPDQFSNYLTEASQVYEKFTRASFQNNYFIPLLSTSKAQRSIKYQDSLIWNALDANLKHARHCNLSKQNLKTYSCKNMIKKHKLKSFHYSFYLLIYLFLNNKRFLFLSSLFLPFPSLPLLCTCLLVCSQKKKKKE